MGGATVAGGGTLCLGRLSGREEVGRGIYLLDFDIPGVGGVDVTPLPGQFYHVECGGGREHLLRRPLSVHGVTRDGGRPGLSFMVEVVGWGTGRLCELEVGDQVSILGPLGRPFDLFSGGRMLLVSGGMGVAPLYFAAVEMDRAGSEYDLLAGFSTKDVCYGRLNGLGGSVTVYTEDGSVGVKGMVSEGVAERVAAGGYSSAIAVGPESMMEAVAACCEREGVPCQVSLATRMGCGIGACRGCVHRGTGGRMLCVCTEGPVFDSREVAWRRPG